MIPDDQLEKLGNRFLDITSIFSEEYMSILKEFLAQNQDLNVLLADQYQISKEIVNEREKFFGLKNNFLDQKSKGLYFECEKTEKRIKETSDKIMTLFSEYLNVIVKIKEKIDKIEKTRSSSNYKKYSERFFRGQYSLN